jgi:putative DNA primase/helicase
VNDSTIEKLGELLNENPRGLLHYRDELTGWLGTLDREGHENDRAFFLEAWDGRGRYTYDRIGRGTLHIEAACVSMLGGIQPGPLAQVLRAAVRGGAGDDGLLQRFQLLVYPDAPKMWVNVDRWPNNAARDRAFDVFRRLDRLTPETLGAPVEDGLPILRFAPEAQEFFDGWREGLMKRLRTGDEHPAMEAHLAKFPSLLPSLALLFHLVDAPTMAPGPVTLVAARRAAAWCDFLEAHARRVYQSVTSEGLKAARALLRKLRAGRLASRFTSRDVYRSAWAGLADREAVEEALAILENHGWVRRTVIATGGHPKTEYLAHPSIRGREAA